MLVPASHRLAAVADATVPTADPSLRSSAADLPIGIGRQPLAHIAFLALAALALSFEAQAQVGLSAAIVSDYRVRGVSLGDGRPSLQLTLNDDAGAGWYGGLSVVTAALAQEHRYTQWLGYAGRVIALTEALNMELGGSLVHVTSPFQYDYGEAYAGLLGERWNARLSYAPDYFGRHLQTGYVEANSYLPLDNGLRLVGHVGLLTVLAGDPGNSGRSRVDVRLGAGALRGDWDFQFAWVAASAKGPYLVAGGRRSAWLASVAYSY